ncbi:XrtA system polysaccharide chain length determinant [Marinobacter sp. CHS3-4]|uniref:XrtA system polysaccharide chain length determinant n=1 Tax=Marinobacter sp. CHS3-4 TaxID=3045174 RepID=UPI0024B524F4|nr:XrtA system polysaccharide chain length determinant [Marinobacter sp. CHS3-4]MDI9245592.1 GNVR domain-containing protein [Marinobacter sp. CHS3-4]
MALPLSDLPKEAIREVRSRKGLAFLLFVGVSFVVLAAGFVWPYKYESEVVIFVDDSNIIRPLMEGSAVPTDISDRASAAAELLSTRDVLTGVARDKSIFGDEAVDLTEEKLEERIAYLRSNMNVRLRQENYFSIGFSAQSPLKAFKIAQKLGQAFIEENNERRRRESRSAYDFIDKQVKSYERQISEVEARLQRFLSDNVDGTEGEANSRMARLRSEMELAELELEELKSRESSLQQQLASIQPTLQGKSGDAYQQRIRTLEEKLDSLRLQYHDSYPDIAILKEQIAELRKQRDQAQENDAQPSDTGGETISNPVYQDVRSQLVSTRTDIQTIETRIGSLERLMAEQEKRMQRIQANKAEYSELTRDMAVNKEIYDDLLKRREKARVSMHLDIEGQGLNYQINETAQYPRTPEGPKFEMFALSGLLLGIVAPFGAAVGWAQVDPRVRSREQVEEELDMLVLEHIPAVRTPYEKRRDRRTTAFLLFLAFAAAAAYVGVAVARYLGVI